MGIILRHESIFCMKIIYGNRFEGGVFIDSCFNAMFWIWISFWISHIISHNQKDKDLFGINQLDTHTHTNTNWYYGYEDKNLNGF